MTINFTIVVQAIHFFLAYVIFTKLFIKPVLKVLNEEEQHEKELLLTLNLETKKFEERNKNKELLWKESLIKFSESKPDIEKLNLDTNFVWPSLKVYKSDSSSSLLSKEALNFLKDKITHVK